MNTEPKLTGHIYDVVSEKTILLIGEYPDNTEDVEGWNIKLIKYELWDDGDIVPCDAMTITSTTKENEVEYLKSVVKTSAVFMIAFELGITQFKAYEMFK